MSKKTFVNVVNNILKKLEQDRDFGDAMSQIFDGHFVLRDDYMLESLFQVLEELIDPHQYIQWWIFEDVEKKVWIGDLEVDVSTPEKLYDFLVNNQ